MRHSAGTWSGKTSEVPRFPEGAQRETASHSEPEKWDTVSGWHEKSPHSSYELRGLMRCGALCLGR